MALAVINPAGKPPWNHKAEEKAAWLRRQRSLPDTNHIGRQKPGIRHERTTPDTQTNTNYHWIYT
jgi:hypothetical protein